MNKIIFGVIALLTTLSLTAMAVTDETEIEARALAKGVDAAVRGVATTIVLEGPTDGEVYDTTHEGP